MSTPASSSDLRLALPKGRMQEQVFKLLADAGIRLTTGSRSYRPVISLPGFETKILKPQNIVEMLDLGSRDVGFAGADWVAELKANVIEVVDTGLDPVRIVAAIPTEYLVNGELPKRPLIVASEYETLARDWIAARGQGDKFVRSYGATEVFPPEDADVIIDNTATGSTLRANGLEIVATLMTSSTRMYVNPRVMDDKVRRPALDRLVLLLNSVLEARRRVMIEVNVGADFLEAVAKVLPSMREHTISQLHHGAGFALKSAVLRKDLPHVIPQLKAAGGTDIVVTDIAQIVP